MMYVQITIKTFFKRNPKGNSVKTSECGLQALGVLNYIVVTRITLAHVPFIAVHFR